MSAQKSSLVRVFNRGTKTYQHGEFKLLPLSHADVPQDVADGWCGITHFGEKQVVLGSEMTALPSDPVAQEKVEKLSKENQALQDRIANLEKLVSEAQSHKAKSRKPSLHSTHSLVD